MSWRSDIVLPGPAGVAFAEVGAFAVEPGEAGVPEGTATIVLLGPRPRAMWAAFEAAPEAADGLADPLDRWTRRLVEPMAAELGAVAIFPFGGPPYAPFIAWAQRGEGARPSPVGMLVSPARGLWASYRAALAFREALPLRPVEAPDPCEGCPAPCLTACPVGALGGATGYDVPACIGHVRAVEGVSCRSAGCLARRACPYGADAMPTERQRAFHMRAFIGAQIAT